MTHYFRAQPGAIPEQGPAGGPEISTLIGDLLCVNADRLCIDVPGNLVRCASTVAMRQWVSACAAPSCRFR